MPEMHIVDIIITGSNANFNYTEQSDLDLHVVINLQQAKDKYGLITEEYLDAKKRLWNDTHDITIYGHPIELYIQDEDEPHIASAIYSLKKDEWLKEPKYEKPDINNSSVQRKAAQFMNEIDELAEENDSCNPKAADVLVEKLKKYRKAGLEKAGEFSTENLVFKMLRNNGYIEKLMKCRVKGTDERLSVEDEEWWK